MAGLYLSIKTDILALWSANWTQTVPVYWRDDDPDPLPDPGSVAQWMRNEIDFGREAVLAFGQGRGANLKAQFGSVVLRMFTARSVMSEDAALETMHAAMAVFRSQRVTGSYQGNTADLSFVGQGSGFDTGPSEDGNWFYRGALMVFEYRFRG